MLIQWLWQQHVMWDEPLDKDLLSDWMARLAGICKCADISVEQRYFNIIFMQYGNNMKLHLFANTSTKGYSATIFLCCSDHTTFVAAKGCEAPLKQITLLKLELMAAAIATRLTRCDWLSETVCTSFVDRQSNCVILASAYKAITAIYQSLSERDNTTYSQCHMEALPNCGQPHRPPYQKPQFWLIQHILIMVAWPWVVNKSRQMATKEPIFSLPTTCCSSHSR